MVEPRPAAAQRVAIIGGGCAAITAAFELTRPEHEGRYAVTIYQQGFRLGGKGASGRGANGRIEEHGLHVWLGYYENAFRMMRECYAELGRTRETCPIADWTDAFVPANHVAAADRVTGERWSAWRAHFPAHPGLPGDPVSRHEPLAVSDYLGRALALVSELLRTLPVEPAERERMASSDPAPDRAAAQSGIEQLLRYGTLAGLGALLEALRYVAIALQSTPSFGESQLLRLIDIVTRGLSRELERYVRDRDELRRVWAIVDLVLATVRGSIRHRLAFDERGFDAIDDYDCREWLRLNGASEESLNCAFVRALYDLAFAYEGGDKARPRIAAGASIRGALRAFFTYKGAFFWKMQAGMGDVVFAPLYEVLKRRGVRFEFFHRLREVEVGFDAVPAADGGEPSKFVRALRFDVQAALHDDGEYQPLVQIQGLPCWPARPDFSQLVDGPQLAAAGVDFESHFETRAVASKTLQVSADFDFVVLGVGVAALPHVARALLDHDVRYRAMVEHVGTVPTRALQLWLQPRMPELGCAYDPVSLSGFLEPFDTWADMTQLAAVEAWPEPPGAIAYLCSVLPEPGPLDRAGELACREAVRRDAIAFLNRDLGKLWPGSVTATGSFRWEMLLQPTAAGAPPAHPIDGQYWTANVSPSERYTLCLPGSTKFRISPLDRAYDNLTLAGDWTACGLNLGCVEAAVISGMLAAHAIARAPELEHIVGFDHP